MYLESLRDQKVRFLNCTFIVGLFEAPSAVCHPQRILSLGSMKTRRRTAQRISDFVVAVRKFMVLIVPMMLLYCYCQLFDAPKCSLEMDMDGALCSLKIFSGYRVAIGCLIAGGHIV